MLREQPQNHRRRRVMVAEKENTQQQRHHHHHHQPKQAIMMLDEQHHHQYQHRHGPPKAIIAVRNKTTKKQQPQQNASSKSSNELERILHGISAAAQSAQQRQNSLTILRNALQKQQQEEEQNQNHGIESSSKQQDDMPETTRRKVERLLVQQLALCVPKPQQQQHDNDDMLLRVRLLLLECFESLWSSSCSFSNSAKVTTNYFFQQALPSLLSIWQHTLNNNNNDTAYYYKMQIRILNIFSSVIRGRQQQLNRGVHNNSNKHVLILRSNAVALTVQSIQQAYNQWLVDYSLFVMNDIDDGYDDEESTTMQQQQPRQLLQTLLVSLFVFIKDLTFRSNDDISSDGDEQQQQMTHYLYKHFMFETVLEYGCGSWNTDEQLQAVTEAATATLWNFAASATLTKQMAANALVWIKLQYLWTSTTSETTECLQQQQQSEILQRNLSAIVGTLVAAATTTSTTTSTTTTAVQKDSDKQKVAAKKKNKVDNNDNTIVERLQEQTWLVPCLLQALEEQNSCKRNKDYRRRCMRTIRCLASCPWGRVFLWQHAPSPLSYLSTILMQVLRSQKLQDADTQIQACQTLTSLLATFADDIIIRSGACSSSNDNNHYTDDDCMAVTMILGPSLETTLVQMIEDKNDYMELADNKLVLVACQSLTTSLRCSPWQRSAECFCSSTTSNNAFFEQILTVLREQVDRPSYHIGFSELLVQLLMLDDDQDEGNNNNRRRTRIRGISTLLASSSTVVEILTTLLSSPIIGAHPEFDASRQNAVTALTALVRDDERNKKPLAADENLLSALTNICLMTTTTTTSSKNNKVSLKDGAKNLILALVPEL